VPDVSAATGPRADADVVQALVEELLRTGLALTGVLSSLIEDLSDDAFPGEDNAEVLLEMVVGTCRPAVAAAGESAARAAIDLISSVRESVLRDLKAAARLARERERRLPTQAARRGARSCQ
jgi:hypothetical protein